MHANLKDITGQQFGKLIVLSRGRTTRSRQVHWICQCRCGNITEVQGSNLRNGHTKSCGCLLGCFHGQTKNNRTTPIYRVYVNMMTRCYNPHNKAYKNYGARGITVCDRWKYSFSKFLADMGEKPGRLTLDRINNNKGYSPENCRWITYRKQAQNTRKNIFIDFDGKILCLTEWARIKNMPYSTLWNRLYTLNWTVGKALTVPIKIYAR